METKGGQQSPQNGVVEAYKSHIDRTLIRENLRLSVQQRFENLMRLQEFAEELRRARTKPDDHTV